MADSTKLFSQQIGKALEPHGAVAAFCRKTGFNRETVDRWIEEEASPTLRNLDKVAVALERDAWDLIRPREAGELVTFDIDWDQLKREIGAGGVAAVEKAMRRPLHDVTPRNLTSHGVKLLKAADPSHDDDFQDVLAALRKANPLKIEAVRRTLGLLEDVEESAERGVDPHHRGPKPRKP